jgi:hypothetical protein
MESERFDAFTLQVGAAGAGRRQITRMVAGTLLGGALGSVAA